MKPSSTLFTWVLSACVLLTLPLTTMGETPSRLPLPISPPERIQTIKSITYTIKSSTPPTLELRIVATVPREGYRQETLIPRISETPPADGIWEYDFLAFPPISAAPVSQVQAELTITHRWVGYDPHQVKGIHIYGVGAGIKEIRFTP